MGFGRFSIKIFMGTRPTWRGEPWDRCSTIFNHALNKKSTYACGTLPFLQQDTGIFIVQSSANCSSLTLHARSGKWFFLRISNSHFILIFIKKSKPVECGPPPPPPPPPPRFSKTFFKRKQSPKNPSSHDAPKLFFLTSFFQFFLFFFVFFVFCWRLLSIDLGHQNKTQQGE